MSTPIRVPFTLEAPINLVDFSAICANTNQYRLEPGVYVLEKVRNPHGGSTEAVSWFVLVKDGQPTTIGTSLPNWEDHGRFGIEEVAKVA